MSEDIYQTPQSDLTTTAPQKSAPVKAIVIATIIDIVGTMVLGMVIGIAYSAILTSSGMPFEEIVRTLENETGNILSIMSIIGVVTGGMVTGSAGYICAKIANSSEYKVVSIFGAITVTFGALMGMAYYSVAENIVLGMITLGCAYGGAWLYVRNKNEGAN